MQKFLLQIFFDLRCKFFFFKFLRIKVFRSSQIFLQNFSTTKFFSLEGSLFPNFVFKKFSTLQFFSLIFHLNFFFSNFFL